MTRLLALALASLSLAPTAFSAQEAPPNPRCAPFTTIERNLLAAHGEQPHPVGLSAAGHILYLFVNEDTGSWTVVARRPDGVGCGVDAGENFGEVPNAPNKPKQSGASFTPTQGAHPPSGAHDPYKGYVRSNGTTSCCGDRDCSPAPYDHIRGLLQLPNGEWVDPRTHENADNSRPAIYWSFDHNAHTCIAAGKLVCAFIPGQGA